jgi:gliding motility-associated-like protein
MDENGCLSTPFSVVLPDVFSLNTSLNTSYNGANVSCYGFSDGEAISAATGGTLPYSYAWSNGQTTAIATNLAAGTYTVQVTDGNGCILNGSITLSNPALLEQALSAQTYPSGSNVSCFGYNDGNIDLTITGGIQPYTYLWSNGSSTEDQMDLNAGTYSVTATDLNGCEVIASLVLTEPEGMTHSLNASTYQSGSNISCNGESDGSADLTISGGTPPYAFLWSCGSTNEDLTGVTAGIYTVTVSEMNGCTVTASIVLTEPDALSISGATLDPACHGFMNGSIDATITGGSTPYVYAWSEGQTCEDVTDLEAGTYTLMLTDENGCQKSHDFILTEPNPLTMELESPLNFHEHNISLNGEKDGSIDLTINGGTQPYSYNWSNGAQSAEIDGLTAGIYFVTVVDAQGCTLSDSIKLTQPFELELPTIFTPNSDGENDVFDIHGIEAYPDNELIVVNRWGNVVYEEDRYNNTWKGTHKNGEELPDGVYFVILKINAGEIEKNTYVHIKKY